MTDAQAPTPSASLTQLRARARNCPFCGSMPHLTEQPRRRGPAIRVRCAHKDCGIYSKWMSFIAWQARAINN